MFVVYHVESTMENCRYQHRGHAVRKAAKLGAKYAVASLEEYNKDVVKMVTKVNMMTGKEFQIASNTPAYCDPSCESYWSM